MKRKKLKRNLEKAIKDYIRAFEKKQGMYFDYAVADDLTGVLCFGDIYLNFSDIVHDIEADIPSGRILTWYDYSIGLAFENNPFANYKNWLKTEKGNK